MADQPETVVVPKEQDNALDKEIADLEKQLDTPTFNAVENIEPPPDEEPAKDGEPTGEQPTGEAATPEEQAKKEILEAKEDAPPAESEWPALADGQETPVPSDWGKARDRFNEEKARRKELETQLQELTAKAEQESEATDPPPQPPAEDAISTDEVVQHFMQARNGDWATVSENEQIEKLAIESFEQMNLEELDAIRQRAQGGLFGSGSADVVEAVDKALPIATARAQQEIMAERAEETNLETQVQEQKKLRLDTYNEMLKEYPDLSDENSALYKFGLEWSQKNIGTTEKPGPEFEKYTTDPDAPRIVIPKMVMDFNKSGGTPASPSPSDNGSGVDTVSEENRELRNQIESINQGESTDRRHTASTKGTATDAELQSVEQELQKLGAIS